jgi:hypothetical protein
VDQLEDLEVSLVDKEVVETLQVDNSVVQEVGHSVVQEVGHSVVQEVGHSVVLEAMVETVHLDLEEMAALGDSEITELEECLEIHLIILTVAQILVLVQVQAHLQAHNMLIKQELSSKNMTIVKVVQRNTRKLNKMNQAQQVKKVQMSPFVKEEINCLSLSMKEHLIQG